MDNPNVSNIVIAGASDKKKNNNEDKDNKVVHRYSLGVAEEAQQKAKMNSDATSAEGNDNNSDNKNDNNADTNTDIKIDQPLRPSDNPKRILPACKKTNSVVKFPEKVSFFIFFFLKRTMCNYPFNNLVINFSFYAYTRFLSFYEFVLWFVDDEFDELRYHGRSSCQTSSKRWQTILYCVVARWQSIRHSRH